MSGLGEFLFLFLLISLIVALACAAIREARWRVLFQEATRFFLMMVVGILAFSVVVYFLEWAFNRKL